MPRLEQEIHGDIHMIQHQIGSGARADLNALKALRADNAQLRRDLDAARSANESMRSEKSRETQALGQRVIELRAELAGKEAWGARLNSELDSLRQTLPDLRDRQLLARRAERRRSPGRRPEREMSRRWRANWPACGDCSHAVTKR